MRVNQHGRELEPWEVEDEALPAGPAAGEDAGVAARKPNWRESEYGRLICIIFDEANQALLCRITSGKDSRDLQDDKAIQSPWEQIAE